MRLSIAVEKARNYAIDKHKEQMYGDFPYVYHLDAVYQIVTDFNLGEEYQIAAYLHDVMEDCEVSRDEITTLFGEHISDMVFAVSGFGETRKIRHEDMKSKMEMNVFSINLKMADRLANIKSSKVFKPKLYLTYKKEHLDFIPLFSNGLIDLFKEIEKELDIFPQTTQTFKLN